MAGHVTRTEKTRNFPKGGWEARFKVDGRWKGKTFARKVDADNYLATVTVQKGEGTFVNPADGRTAFRTVASDWLATAELKLKPKTLDEYQRTVRVHLLPHWGEARVGEVDFGAVQRWVTHLATTPNPRTGELHSPVLIRSVYKVLRLVMGYAVKCRMVPMNPCGPNITLPRAADKEMHFLTHPQVEALAEAISYVPRRHPQGRDISRPDLGLLVRFAAYTGLRAGEIAALKVKHIDFASRRVNVREATVDISGRMHTDTPKTRGSVRAVRVDAELFAELKAHVESRRFNPEGYVFVSEQGLQFRFSNLTRFWKDAVARAGVPTGLRFHDLRHTYASLMFAAGASVKEVQRSIGHASAQLTLDRYTHLMPDAEDATSDRLGAARSAALVADGRETKQIL